ncbi:hypothetical protein MUP95_09360, partial [bacterium]|nr:hypothetical protein [bacterium]
MTDNSEINHVRLIIDTLNQRQASIGPWIHRKEIAVWAAVLLYLSGLSVFSKLVFESSNQIPFWGFSLFAILVIIMCILFGLFIHTQFASIYSDLALRRAIDTWVFKFVEISKVIPKSWKWEYEEDQVFPKPIIALIKMQLRENWEYNKNFKKLEFKPNKKFKDKDYRNFLPDEDTLLRPLRSFSLLRRCWLPIKLLASKVIKKIEVREHSLMEREEGIIYLLFVTPTLLMLVFGVVKLIGGFKMALQDIGLIAFGTILGFLGTFWIEQLRHRRGKKERRKFAKKLLEEIILEVEKGIDRAK